MQGTVYLSTIENCFDYQEVVSYPMPEHVDELRSIVQINSSILSLQLLITQVARGSSFMHLVFDSAVTFFITMNLERVLQYDIPFS